MTGAPSYQTVFEVALLAEQLLDYFHHLVSTCIHQITLQTQRRQLLSLELKQMSGMLGHTTGQTEAQRARYITGRCVTYTRGQEMKMGRKFLDSWCMKITGYKYHMTSFLHTTT